MPDKMFPINTSLAVVICKDADEAIAQGHDYKDKDVTGLRIHHAVVVKSGTVEGNPTVDFVMEDEKGNKYVTLITGNLLKMLSLK